MRSVRNKETNASPLAHGHNPCPIAGVSPSAAQTRREVSIRRASAMRLAILLLPRLLLFRPARGGWSLRRWNTGRGPQWPDGLQPVRLREGRPLWHVSSLERGGAEVASQQRLNRGRSMCGSPRGTRHQHADGHDGLCDESQ